MRVGDLVQFDDYYVKEDDRQVGTVLKFDLYRGGDDCGTARGPAESLVQVMWGTGEVGWILERRVRVISEGR